MLGDICTTSDVQEMFKHYARRSRRTVMLMVKIMANVGCSADEEMHLCGKLQFKFVVCKKYYRRTATLSNQLNRPRNYVTMFRV